MFFFTALHFPSTIQRSQKKTTFNSRGKYPPFFCFYHPDRYKGSSSVQTQAWRLSGNLMMTRRFQEVTGATKKYLQCLKPRRITWSDVCSPRFLCGLHRRDTGCSLVSWWALWTKPGELFIPVSGLYYGGPDGQNRTTAHKRFSKML